MIIRSKVPLRISFCGGGTEVEPYLSERGGIVLCATIDMYGYGSIRLQNGERVAITSLDYDTVARFNIDEPLKYDGKLHLIKASILR